MAGVGISRSLVSPQRGAVFGRHDDKGAPAAVLQMCHESGDVIKQFFHARPVVHCAGQLCVRAGNDAIAVVKADAVIEQGNPRV